MTQACVGKAQSGPETCLGWRLGGLGSLQGAGWGLGKKHQEQEKGSAGPQGRRQAKGPALDRGSWNREETHHVGGRGGGCLSRT